MGLNYDLSRQVTDQFPQIHVVCDLKRQSQPSFYLMCQKCVNIEVKSSVLRGHARLHPLLCLLERCFDEEDLTRLLSSRLTLNQGHTCVAARLQLH